jgi:hypothetical protein
MALTGAIKPLGPMPVRIKFEYFLDRAVVKAMIDEKTRRGLVRCGLAIMQNARRSIKKMGMARPQLAAQKTYRGASLEQLLTFGDKMVSKATKRKIVERMQEIKARDPSKAGTPPHTHTGVMRNSIVFAYDPSSESVVVGGFMQGIQNILALHEFGGIQTMQAWAWIPGDGRKWSGLIGWWALGRKPRLNPGQWEPLGSQWRETFPYPARPYMRPAMLKAIREKEIVKQFAGRISVGG